MHNLHSNVEIAHHRTFIKWLWSKLKGRGHHSHSSRRDLEAPWGCCSCLLTLSPFAFRRRRLSCSSLCHHAAPPPPLLRRRRRLFKTSPHLLNTTWPSIHATFSPPWSHPRNQQDMKFRHACKNYIWAAKEHVCVELSRRSHRRSRRRLMPCGFGAVAAPKICMYES